jgi:hypothetical protein
MTSQRFDYLLSMVIEACKNKLAYHVEHDRVKPATKTQQVYTQGYYDGWRAALQTANKNGWLR